uniref:Uncharacterized protein n=1 Tax=Panagrolaimus sp. JU765 TaxID=591449 RepID=A0AC34QEM3_9BILA
MNILLPPKTIVKPSDVSITGVQTDLNVAVDNLNVAVVFEQHEAINLVYVDMDKEATKEWTPEEIENKRFQLKWKETRCRMEVYNVIRKFLPPLPPGFKGLPKVEPKALTTATEERVRPEDMVDGGHLEETKDEPEKPEEQPETEGKYLKTEENPPNREPEEKPETEGKYLKTEENPPNQHESATIQENGGKQGNEDAKV